MNLTQLRKKFHNATPSFQKNKDINGTNIVEEQTDPLAQRVLRFGFCFDKVEKVSENSFLNYIGCDYVVEKNGVTFMVDLKTCNNMAGYEVMTDGLRKDENKEWECALDQKATDFFLYINKDNCILVRRDYIYEFLKNAKENDFYILGKKDKYQTTKKINIILQKEDINKKFQVIPRNSCEKASCLFIS